MAIKKPLARRILLTTITFFVVFGVGQAANDEKEKLKIGARLGPAIPSESIADVYNQLDTSGLGAAYETAASLGWNLAAHARIGVSSNVSLSGGIGFVQFPGQDLILTDVTNQKTYHLTTSTIFVPISAGFSWLMMREAIVPIIHAEAMVNYRKSIVSDGDIVADLLSPGMTVEPEVVRFGAQVGFSLELDLGIRPQLDVTYSFTNILGKEPGELDKNYLTIGIGIVF